MRTKRLVTLLIMSSCYTGCSEKENADNVTFPRVGEDGAETVSPSEPDINPDLHDSIEPVMLGDAKADAIQKVPHGETDKSDAELPRNETNETETDSTSEQAENPDVCNFEKPVTLGEVEADGMIMIPPSHPEIRYIGRVDCSTNGGPSFAFPGVSIRAKFEGDAIDMVFDDNGNSGQPNFYNIIIDNGEPQVLEMIPGENTYNLANGLSNGEHIVEIFKRIESNYNGGRGRFLGFRIAAGTDLLPVEPKPYRIELIGDSITCGYGNEISVDDPTYYHYTTRNSNAYNAWGAIAARKLDAEYMAIAYSGRGVYRNYADEASETIPEMYLDSLPDDPYGAAWDVTRYIPDVVVINLGTNDFSPGIEIENIATATADFELAFLKFVETLRDYYGEAVFILAIGPMLSDSYPSGYQALTNVTEAMEAIIAARKADGDENVHLLILPSQTSPFGEDWHPTVATHIEMAEQLVRLIENLGWPK